MTQSTGKTAGKTAETKPRNDDGRLGPGQLGANTEVVEAEIIPSTGEMIPLGAASQTVIQWCADNVSVGDTDTASAMEDMIRQVLAAEDATQVLTEQLAIPVEKVLDRPIRLNGIRIGETDFADGFPYYALCDVQVGDTLQPRVVTVGAFKVMAQLFRLVQLDALPLTVMFKKAEKPTKAGYYPISLVLP